MKREEVIDLLKEIVVECQGIEGCAIMIMPPNADNVLSHGYQLHIQKCMQSDTITCMTAVAKRHNLFVNIEPSLEVIVIYRPIQDKAT